LKIAVLSDSHIPTRLGAIPGRVYEICAESDLILHSGDIVNPAVIIDLERFAPVKAVCGNMDPYEIRNRYPEILELELEGHKIVMTHGTGARFGIENRILKKLKPRNPDIIIFGHSHIFHDDTMDGVLRLNPGAVSGSSGNRTMALLTIFEGKEPIVEKIQF
jgi:uncharacterized protein